MVHLRRCGGRCYHGHDSRGTCARTGRGPTSFLLTSVSSKFPSVLFRRFFRVRGQVTTIVVGLVYCLVSGGVYLRFVVAKEAVLCVVGGLFRFVWQGVVFGVPTRRSFYDLTVRLRSLLSSGGRPKYYIRCCRLWPGQDWLTEGDDEDSGHLYYFRYYSLDFR